MSENQISRIVKKAQGRQKNPSASPGYSIASEIQGLANTSEKKDFFRAVAAVISNANEATTFVYTIEADKLSFVASKIRNPMPPGLLETDEIGKFLSSSLTKSEPSVLAIGHFGLRLCVFCLNKEEPVGIAQFLQIRAKEKDSFPPAIADAIPILRLSYEQWKLGEELKNSKEGLNQAFLFLEMIYQSSTAPSFRRAVQILSEELRNFVGAENLAIGLGSSLNCKLEAFSSSSKFDKKSHTVSNVNQLLREAVAVGSAVGWPSEMVSSNSFVEAASDQEELAKAYKVKMITAHPLKTAEGDSLGTWICFWKSTPSPNRLEIVEAMSPHLASTVNLLRLAKPRGIRGFIQRNFFDVKWAKIGIPLIVLGLMIAAMFLQIPYKIGSSCWIDPTVRRQVAVPFDGILEKPFVEPGDFVEAGDLLARLDGKDIAWKVADLKARSNSLEKKKTQAMAQDGINESQLIELEIEALKVELNHLNYQQENLQVKAPIEGMILTGDLEQSAGVPVQRGQRLFDISPIKNLTAIVAIPGNEIRSATAGMEVRVRLESETSFNHTGILESIEPVSTIHEGKNVFLGKVRFENPNGRLRPGMRGRAQIVSGKRSLGWILFHRPFEYFRLHRPW